MWWDKEKTPERGIEGKVKLAWFEDWKGRRGWEYFPLQKRSSLGNNIKIVAINAYWNDFFFLFPTVTANSIATCYCKKIFIAMLICCNKFFNKFFFFFIKKYLLQWYILLLRLTTGWSGSSLDSTRTRPAQVGWESIRPATDHRSPRVESDRSLKND